MPVPTKPSNAPGTSLSFITIGSILAVLAGTSYFYFSGNNSLHPVLGYLRLCAFILGIVFLFIGFGVGRIGRVAREAEITPADTAAPIAPGAPPVAPQPTNVNPVYTTSTTPR